MDTKSAFKYTVGALLYSPAVNNNIASSIINQRFGNNFSLAICLEDSINDYSIDFAEEQVLRTLNQITEEKKTKDFYMPKIFIRVREPKQAIKVFNMINKNISILTGFIFPKFCLNNAHEYIKVIKQINSQSSKQIYMMPILEDIELINLKSRIETLYNIKELLDLVCEYVLNIRIGGNDLCHAFGLRRHIDETIYDIKPISNILSDILTVFSNNYVISSVVWEYFSEDNPLWKEGLQKELKLDILNGFIGKTVIHPNQIAVINEALKVTRSDYDDAIDILNWDNSSKLMVSKSSSGRMNEFKTHYNWANKIIILSEIYGIKD